MDELDKLRELRQSISRAREACAGSDINNYDKVYIYLEDTVREAVKLEFNEYARRLNEIKQMIHTSLTQKERLEADNKLCNILNELDKKIKELE